MIPVIYRTGSPEIEYHFTEHWERLEQGMHRAKRNRRVVWVPQYRSKEGQIILAMEFQRTTPPPNKPQQPAQIMKLWQHEDTGNITVSETQPSERWFGIPTMYEDELPDDISQDLYDRWFENSFVDFVRIGPKIEQ